MEIIAATTLIKDEEDIIFYNLEHKFKQGIRIFGILNNNSTDNTLEEIERFKNTYKESIVEVFEDRKVGHYQGDKMTWISNFIFHKYEVKWILPFDADEILEIKNNRNISEILKSYNIEEPGVIWMKLKNFMLKENYDSSIKNPLERITHRLPFEKENYRLGKIIVRWKNNIRLDEGNHIATYENRKVELKKILLGEELGLWIRHYSMRTKNHIRKKIINGGIAFLAASSIPNYYGTHWRERWENYIKYGEEYIDKLYNDQLLIGKTCIFDPIN